KNPCHPALAITNAPVFKHHPPAIAWLHKDIGTYTPVYDAAGKGTYVAIGTPGAPVQGEQFAGFCSMGGAFNRGGTSPPDFPGAPFHAARGLGGTRVSRCDGADKPVSVDGFAESAGPVVAIAMSPQDGRLYYINYGNTGSSDVRRIGFVIGNK